MAPSASTITLARTTHRPAHDPNALEIELRVIDQGPGMTATERAHACDRFWRGTQGGITHDGTTHDGTELGLAIVAQLVRSSGGEITLLPAPGGGLEVLIRLRSAHRSPIKGRTNTTKQPSHVP